MMSSSGVSGGAYRRRFLIVAKSCSMGFKSGEYRGQKEQPMPSLVDQFSGQSRFMKSSIVHDKGLSGAPAL